MSKARPFRTEWVPCVEAHLGTLANGDPYVVRVGDRLRADSEPVRRCPMYFVNEGDPLIRPEPAEVREEPPPPPRRPVPMLRTRMNWSGSVTVPGRGGLDDQRLRITLTAGKTLRADTSWLHALTDRQRAHLFESVQD